MYTLSSDRTIKVLLTLLVIGVWGLLLRPLFPISPAYAQDQKANPLPPMSPVIVTAPPEHLVYVAAPVNFQGNLEVFKPKADKDAPGGYSIIRLAPPEAGK